MRAVVFVVGIALANPAHAQAPGEVAPAPAPISRFAVGLELGGVGLHRADADREASFGVLELAGRYRIARSFELGLSLWGGGAKEGTLEMGGVFLDARYRLLGEGRWNLYAGVSLGVMSVYDTVSDTDRNKHARGALRLGAGIERRFGPLSVGAQLRLLGVAENDRYAFSDVSSADEVLAADELQGGALTLGVAYHF